MNEKRPFAELDLLSRALIATKFIWWIIFRPSKVSYGGPDAA